MDFSTLQSNSQRKQSGDTISNPWACETEVLHLSLRSALKSLNCMLFWTALNGFCPIIGASYTSLFTRKITLWTLQTTLWNTLNYHCTGLNHGLIQASFWMQIDLCWTLNSTLLLPHCSNACQFHSLLSKSGAIPRIQACVTRPFRLIEGVFKDNSGWKLCIITT